MSTTSKPAVTPEKHGVYVAGYDNLGLQALGHACPFMECDCGFITSRGASNWEEVGREFDEHLK